MQKVPKTRKNLLKCLCKKCPTYSFTCKMMSIPGNIILLMDTKDDRLHAETMFCAYSKSQCIKDEKGCICRKCEVYKENELSGMYFCLEDGGK
ncbi:MAG: DUF2769 domain-containing protein [Bacillota bacterium]|nr:DUF2769 domain-containing protein [Bacillota bacterium]